MDKTKSEVSDEAVNEKKDVDDGMRNEANDEAVNEKMDVNDGMRNEANDEMKTVKKRLRERILTRLMIGYINLAYKTSKIIKTGNVELLDSDHKEKFVIAFWHGDAYCCYTLFKDSGVYIMTTKNKRGDYIDSICRYFGYNPIRLPDEMEGGTHLLKLRQQVNGENKQHLAMTLDGPLGPRHVPKKLALITAMAMGRKIILISIKVKRKICFKRRWDKMIIPLPFCTIEYHFHEPLEIHRNNIDKKADEIVEMIGISQNAIQGP